MLKISNCPLFARSRNYFAAQNHSNRPEFDVTDSGHYDFISLLSHFFYATLCVLLQSCDQFSFRTKIARSIARVCPINKQDSIDNNSLC